MTKQKKYFGTDGVRGYVGQSLINPAFVLQLAWAAGRVLCPTGGKVVIGKDTRISGYMLESALEAGFTSAGVDTLLLGPMPTPAIAYLTRAMRANAGVVVSASHNPFYDNGIKFFCADSMKISDEMELEVESYIEKELKVVPAEHIGRAARVKDAPGRYIEFCKSTVPFGMSLKGMKIVVDCAYGATYHIAPLVLRELGAHVVDIATEPDGFNINERCGATAPQLLQKIVKAEGAQVGIALDGDGDRVIMVDQMGEVVDGDELLFIMANYLKRTSALKGGVIGTVMTNFGVETAFKNAGIQFERSAVGDRNVLKALRNRGWDLGGENSGHIVNLAVTTTGDGIISALQILHIMQETQSSLRDLIRPISRTPQALINVKLSKQITAINNVKIENKLKTIKAKLADQGRVLLRPSGTEPMIRVMVEGPDENLVSSCAKELAETIRLEIGIDA